LDDDHGYWLNDWFDQFDIRSDRDIEKLLKGSGGPGAMLVAAELAEVARQQEKLADPVGNLPASGLRTVVADRSMDLSAALSCEAYHCQEQNIDRLFAPIWHYFDEIVVEGLAPHRLLDYVGTADDEEGIHQMVQLMKLHGHLLLYVKRIGAFPFLRFRTKPHAWCTDHFKQDAEALDLHALLDPRAVQASLKDLEDRGSIDVLDEIRSGAYAFKHPSLDYIGMSIPRAADASIPDLSEIVKQVYERHAAALVGDVSLARKLGAPLTTFVSDFIRPQASANDGSAEDSAALEIRLPIIKGLQTRDLLRLRSEHEDEFVRFREAIAAASKEIIGQMGDGANPKVVADRVQREIIEPTTADLTRQFKASRRKLQRKMAAQLGVGFVGATIGHLNGVPLPLSASAVIASGTLCLPYWNSRVDDREKFEESDMYFLWHVAKYRHNE
jgi:hypothetical protein